MSKLVIKHQRRNKLANGTLSKGAQVKYLVDNRWVKLDGCGYEALAEVVSSQLAKQLGVPHTVYEMCIYVQTETVSITSCISESFIPAGYTEVNLATLMNTSVTHVNINDALAVVSPLMGEREALEYFNRLFVFDAIVYNEDRHLRNVSFLEKEGRLYPCPLYDCGAGLLSDTTMEWWMDKPVDECLNELRAYPFDSDIHRQAQYFIDRCGFPFSNKEVVVGFDQFREYYPDSYIERAREVLRRGLDYYGIHLVDSPNSKTNLFQV